jgi:hypothetical protein
MCHSSEPMFHLFKLPTDLVALVLRDWIDMSSLGTLDSALCSAEVRPHYSNLIRADTFVRESMHNKVSSLYWAWLVKRGVRMREWELTSRITPALLLDLATTTGGDQVRSLFLNQIDTATAGTFSVVYHHCTQIGYVGMFMCGNWPQLLAASGDGQTSLHTVLIKDCYDNATATFAPNQYPSLEYLYMEGGCDSLTMTSFFGAAPNLCDLRLRYSLINDFDVCALRNHADQLHTLVLSECEALTSAGVSYLAERCVNLTCLDLSNCEQLDDVAAQSFAAHCPKLKTIQLDGLFTEASVIDLATRCGGTLRHLSLVCLGLHTDGALLSIANHCVKLDQLHLDSCTSVTADSLVLLASSLPYLKGLSLQGCTVVTDTVLTAVATNLRNLHTLSLFGSTGYTEVGALALVRSLTQLRHFTAGHGHPLFSGTTIDQWKEVALGLQVYYSDILLPKFEALADW